MQVFLKPIEDLGMIAWLVPILLVFIVSINYYGLWSKWVVNELGLEELAVASYTFDQARMERGKRTLSYTHTRVSCDLEKRLPNSTPRFT